MNAIAAIHGVHRSANAAAWGRRPALHTAPAAPSPGPAKRVGPQVAAAQLRELHAADGNAVIEFFLGLSPVTLYRRFHHPRQGLSPALVQILRGMDGETHVAVGAFTGDTLIGVARYVRSDEECGLAELALTVGDAYQGQGIGRRLLTALATIAHGKEVHTFVFTVLADNTPAVRLLTPGAQALRTRDGQQEGRLPIASLLG